MNARNTPALEECIKHDEPSGRHGLADDELELVALLLQRGETVDVGDGTGRPRPLGLSEAPLSPPQQRLWFLEQLHPGTASYNVPAAKRLKGPLNILSLRRTLNELVRRHAALRTYFKACDGVPAQVIRPAEEVQVELIDLTAFESEEREARALTLAGAEALTGFDVQRGPLLRPLLLKLSVHEHILLLNMHHIITDGWSLDVLWNELGCIYEAYCSGAESPLEDLPVQYADFAVWQRQCLSGDELRRQLSYWCARLEGFTGVMDLPTDRAPLARFESRGAWATRVFPQLLAEKLKAFSSRENVTLFITLLSTFQLLLSRLTGQTDIGVATPVANRNHVDVERLLGFFVNTLVIRTDLSGNLQFGELLARVRENVLNAFACQDVPFEKIVEEIRPERNPTHRPLAQVMFGLWQHVVAQPDGFGGLQVTQVDIEACASDYLLVVTVAEQGEGFFVRAEYDATAFDKQTVERWLCYYELLLESVVKDSRGRISELTLVGADEGRMLQSWNRTEVTRSSWKTAASLFEERAAATPGATAVVCGDRELNFGELNQKVNALAHFLRGAGAAPEKLVAVCCERGPEFVIAVLGVLKSGAAYVPIDPETPHARIAAILQDTGALAVLTQSRIKSRMATAGTARVFCLDDCPELAAQSCANPQPQSDPENLAYVIFTSGSTGRSKGVMVNHKGLTNYLLWAADYYNVGAAWGSPVYTSISFDLTVTSLLPPLISGRAVLMLPESGPQTLANALSSGHEFSLVKITPAHLAVLNESFKDKELPGCNRAFVIGGEALSAAALLPWRNRAPHVRLINEYGPTEAVVGCCVHEVQPQTSTSGAIPIGRPIANTRLYVLDQECRPVPIGVRGELHIGGDGLARGYLGGPDLTAERFVPDPFSTSPGARLYKSGDVCRYAADGTLEYFGRRDNQVKLRGYRIELEEIEAVLGRHPGVREVAVLLQTRADGDKRLAAFVAPNSDAALDSHSLRAHMAESLPDYMIPVSWVQLARLPQTRNGKIDRAALADMRDNTGNSDQESVRPRTEVEDMLAKIWEEADVLDLKNLDVHDNFFQLGGHSLLATRVLSRVKDAFQVEVPLRSLFDSPTVAGLAKEVESARERAGDATLVLQPIGRSGELELSYAQQRLWFLDQLQPGSAFYNVPLALRISGPLDVSLLERCLSEISRRHEVLRTHFEMRGGRPVQVISPAARVPIEQVDFREEANPEECIRERAGSEARLPFDLNSGPLLRALLMRSSVTEYVLMLNMHHVVADAWSLTVLIQELGKLYELLCAEGPAALPALPIQYADFAAWQREWLKGSELARQTEYWKRQLAGLAGVLELPTDRPRPAVQSSRGARLMLQLPVQLSSDLRAFSQRENVTLFMTLLAAFAALLTRYTGQVDLAIGTPIANRNSSVVEGLIGFFVNSLLLRIDASGEPTFRGLLARVREVSLGAYAHQDLPFERLVEELQPERSLSHNPLCQVMFALHNAPTPRMQFGQLSLVPMEIETSTARCDLALSLEVDGERLSATAEYSTDLFEAATVERLLEHYRTLLAGAVTAPKTMIGDLPLLSPVDLAQLAVAGATHTPGPELAMEVESVETQSQIANNRAAVVTGTEQLSYAELEANANRLARYLRRCGAGPEVLVGICMHRSAEMVTAIVAVHKAGAAYVPLDPEYPPERLRQMVEDAKPIVVLTQKGLEGRLGKTFVPVVSLDVDRARIEQESSERLPQLAGPENLAYVIYTSGSTGKPRGVMVRHRGLSNLVAWHRHTYDINERDRATQIAPIAFDASVWEIWPTLASGASLHIAAAETRSSPSETAAWLRREKITHCFLATPLAELVMPLLIESASSEVGLALRVLLTGGDRLGTVPEKQIPFEFVNHYGPTETTVVATYTRLRPGTKCPPPIGNAISNVQTFVLDEYLRPLPMGVPGMLYIGGAGLARGYLNRPDLTAELFVPNPFDSGTRLYRTGDRVKFLSDGQLEFLGREDQQVKIRGYRIELGEIETALSEHPAVHSAIVIVDEESGGKRLVAYVMPRSGASPEVADLRAHLRARLPRHMIPAALGIVDTLPLNSNGKIDRTALPQLDRTTARGAEVAAPQSALEHAITEIWKRLLRLDPIGVNDNFFELGGHSLLAVEVRTELERVVDHEIPMVDLFTHTTIHSLAKHLGRPVASSMAVEMQVQANRRRQYFANRAHSARNQSNQ
jgi:amino acid adenylation domain-containing protein